MTVLARTERTKRCTRCQTVKPWSDYYASRKWGDGTTRCPQSRCKECRKGVVAAWQRKAYRRWREDPEWLAKHRAQSRESARRTRGTPHDRYRPARRPHHGGPTVPAAPFAAWLRALAPNVEQIAKRTDLNPRRVLDVMKGKQERVELDTVDRALLAVGDGTTLEDLYAREELAA